MFKKLYKYAEKYIFFFIGFNIFFLILLLAFKYALPFILSLIISLWLFPLTNYLYKKTKLNKKFINILCIITSFAIIIGFVGLVGYGIFKELKDIVINISDVNIDLSSIFNKITYLKESSKNISPDITNMVATQIKDTTKNIGTISIGFVNEFIKFLTSIPMIMIIILITMISTFLMLNDFENIKTNFLKLGKNKKSNLIIILLKQSNNILVGYIRSYSFLVTLTFIETLITFKLLGIKYSFTFAIMCALADIIPIIGIGCIFIPLAFTYLLLGNVNSALFSIVAYLIITIIRQIIEPKILSKSLKLNPIIVLMCIYIGMNTFGIVGIMYLFLIIIFYKILKESDVFKKTC